MAAAREEGLIKIVATKPNGATITLMGFKDTRLLAPSGKLAEPEQWYNFNLSPRTLSGTEGWQIQILMQSEASDTLDNANDTIIKLPAVINGVLTTLGKKEFKMRSGEAYASPAVTADVDSLIGVYDLPAGTTFTLGGSKGWLEPYDDTA